MLAQYLFANWKDDLGNVISLYPDFTLNLGTDVIINASYEVAYTLTISSGTGGTTAPAPETYMYHAGSTVPAIALADMNYRFLRWLRDGVFYSFDNPVNILIDADHVLAAEFEYIPPPPPEQSIIMGVVSDNANGLPLEGALVTADGYSQVTGSDGKYSLTVELGVYTVTIAKQGYQTQTKVVDASTPVTIILDIPLQPEGLPPTIDFTAIATIAMPLIFGTALSLDKKK